MEDNRDPQTIRFEPGFFTETSARGAPTRWKSGDRVRFRNGELEKLGGWVAEEITGYSYIPSTETDQFNRGNVGVSRRLCEWTALDGQSFIAVGTSTKLFLVNRSIRYDITPIRRTVTLTNPITVAIDEQLVTITDAGHGANVGDTVYLSNASAVAGVTLSGEYVVQSVLGSTYIVLVDGSPSSSTTGGGTVKIDYELGIGTANQTVALGWGAGPYGRGTYGTARETSNIVRRLRTWSLEHFGEDLIASPRGGAVYHWDRSNGVQTRAQILDQAPASNEIVLVSNSGGRIICLGAFDEVGNTPDKMLIRVGAEESLTDFTLPVNVDEGTDVAEERLSTGSRIVAGVRTRGGNFVSTDRAVYMMFEDPTEIFDVKPIASGNPCVGPNAMLEVDGTVYVMAPTKFMVYDGVYQELPCDVWRFVFQDAGTKITRAQADKVYSFYNEQFAEIWWLYQSGDSSEIDRYVVFNRSNRTWVTGTIRRTCGMPPGTSYDYPLMLAPESAGNGDDTFYLHENGQQDAGTTMEWNAESHDFELGNSKTQMHASRVIMDMTEMAGSLRFQLKTKERPMQEDYVIRGPYKLLPTTKKSGVRAKGRQCALKLLNAPENVTRIFVDTDDDGSYGASPDFGSVISTSFPVDPAPDYQYDVTAFYSADGATTLEITGTGAVVPKLNKGFFTSLLIFLEADGGSDWDTLLSADATFSSPDDDVYRWVWDTTEFSASEVDSNFTLRFDDSRDTFFRLATTTIYLQPDSEE